MMDLLSKLQSTGNSLFLHQNALINENSNQMRLGQPGLFCVCRMRKRFASVSF
ncbi:Uncharacterised protein [Edwardsiella tarda]|nr:Uncharacterised protein [Edwardsiella tarda]